MKSVRHHDRPAVLELGLADGPGAARGAAAQRLDRHLEFVTRLDALARPAVAHQVAGRAAFQAPGLVAAVRLLDDEDDEGVRTGELELLYDAFELDRIVLIEHRE